MRSAAPGWAWVRAAADMAARRFGSLSRPRRVRPVACRGLQAPAPGASQLRRQPPWPRHCGAGDGRLRRQRAPAGPAFRLRQARPRSRRRCAKGPGAQRRSARAYRQRTDRPASVQDRRRSLCRPPSVVSTMARAALVKNGQPGNRIEQRRHDGGQIGVEDARSQRPAKDEQVRRGAGGRTDGEESRTDGNAGDLAIVEPAAGGGKIDCGGLHAFADQTVGKARHGIWLKDHGGHFEQQRRCHRGPEA